MNYKAIIFDMDGTLLDTLSGVIKACNESFKEFGYDIQFTNDDGKYFIGAGATEFGKRALARAGTDKIDFVEYSKVFLKNYSIYQKTGTKPFDGLDVLLNGLRSKKILIGICSNKPQQLLDEVTSLMFPNIKFDLVLGQNEGIPCKPEPMMMRVVEEKLGISKKDILYVGDSIYDYKFAKNSDVDCLIVTYGYGMYDDEFMNDVKFRANSVQELKEMLLK